MEQEKNENKNLMDKMEHDVPDPNTPSMMDQSSQPSLLDQTNQQIPQREPQQAPQFTQPTVPPTSPPVKINYSSDNIDEMEELIESVVDEKWRTLIENVGDIALWKDKVRTEVISIKQEIIRLENRFDNMQKAILGKVKSYDENMVEVGSDIRALEKVFSKILDPLTTNIKELNRLTKELKKK